MNIQNRIDEINEAQAKVDKLKSAFLNDVSEAIGADVKFHFTPDKPLQVAPPAPIAHAKRHGFRLISKATKKAVIKDIRANVLKPAAIASKHKINVSTVYAWQKAL